MTFLRLLLLALCCFTLSAQAQTATPPSIGDGSSGNPYQIATLNNLYWLTQTSTAWDKHFVQTTDIDASSTSGWDSGSGFLPIGNLTISFTGTYDGQNHTIDGLVIDRSSTNYIGFFGRTSGATIQNLGLTNVTINGNDNVGSIIGYNFSSDISDCFSTGDVDGSRYVGGLIGYNYSYVTVENTFSRVVVVGDDYVGGLVGFNFYYSNIINSYATRNVSGTNLVGGLVGSNRNNSDVLESYASGNVNGTNNVGGLVGSNSDNISIAIRNSYAKGIVTGDYRVGGLVGYNDARVYYCYSKGSVSGNTDTGGLVGYNYLGTVYNSFWDTQTSGQSTSDGGEGKSTVEMKQSCTFMSARWDFEDETINGVNNYWTIIATANDGYPALAWQGYGNSLTWPCAIPPYGDGSAGNPYKIEILDHLYWLSQTPTEWDKHFIQIDDIDASPTSGWDDGDGGGAEGFLPIGNFTTAFTGSYDGQSYTINMLVIDRSTTVYVGFFGRTTGATIQNIGLTNVDVSGSVNVGGLVGYCTNSTTVTNSFVTGSVDGRTAVGGLLGRNYDNVTVTNSYAEVTITCEDYGGGLAGRNENSSTIQNSYATGSVSGDDYIAGFIGLNDNNSWILDSYAKGNVNGENYIAGFLALNHNNSTIHNTYAIGSVSGLSNVAGLVAQNTGSLVSKSYWDTETTGQTSSDGGTGKTTLEMKSPCVYLSASWDFDDETDNGTDDDWTINASDNNGYPALAWQGFDNNLSLPCITSPDGDGSAGNPYQIATLDHLYWLSKSSTAWDKYFIQTADISASTTATWDDGDGGSPEGFLPIGNSTTAFTGTYDGQSFTIDSLFIDRNPNNVGLFGKTSGASIQNLSLSNVDITGISYVGSFVGHHDDYSTLTNCSSTGSVSTSQYAGGLVGYLYNHATIENCYSSASASGWHNIGGLVGVISYYCEVKSSYAAGNATGTGNYIGGVAGLNNSNSIIMNCYASGTINGDENIGGLVGTNAASSSILTSYANGSVSGNTDVGGLVGENITSTITGSFWDINTSGQTTSAGGTAKTTAELQSPCTFLSANWDFLDETTNGTNDYWTIHGSENNGYPSLSWQGFANNLSIPCAVAPAGDGSGSNPYQVTSLANLYWMHKSPLELSKIFVQINDIDASITTSWDDGDGGDTDGFYPIGDYDDPFSGSYNGQGHTIDALYINRPGIDFGALFGHTSGATIENVGIINTDITGRNNMSGLIAYNSGSTVTNCFSTGDLIGDKYVSGLVATNDNGSISNSYSKSNVSGNGSVGGLVGSHKDNATVENCYAIGSVSGSAFVGGLIGYNSSSTTTNSFWDTETSGQATSAGGTGKTTAEMKTLCIYFLSGWDFQLETENGTEDNWTIHPVDNNGYPALSWQGLRNDLSKPCAKVPTGDGSGGSPYQITLLSHLYWMAVSVRDSAKDFSGDFFEQPVDIDASLTAIWDEGDGGNPEGFLPIGNITTKFSGTYNAMGHTIDRLTVDRPDSNFVGLFGYTYGSTMENIGLTNVSIRGNEHVGSLVGYHAIGSTIQNSYATGSVVGKADHAGGLAGSNIFNSTVQNCFSTVTVTGLQRVGGLVGYNAISAGIENSFARGMASGTSYVGGLVGYNYFGATVVDCYSTGGVSGTSRSGGLIGFNTDAAISDCFWDTQTSGQSTSAGGNPRTTAQMTKALTFASKGWDFEDEIVNGSNDHWTINSQDNNFYPALAWQGFSNDIITIPAGNLDLHTFTTSGVSFKFAGSNSSVVLNAARTDSVPNGEPPFPVVHLSPRYWTIDLLFGAIDVSNTYNLTFDLSGIPGITSCNSLHILKRDTEADPWENAVFDLGATLDINDCPDSIKVQGLTSLSQFVLGGEQDTPLPVKLAAFSGKVVQGGIELNWKTFTETDNLGFVLHRNGNPVASYASHQNLKGQGTKLQETAYSFLDENIVPKKTYTYQLQSVDLSGQTHYYNQTVTLTLQQPLAYELSQNYPNPFNPGTTINFVMKQAGLAKLVVFDMLGKKVFEKQIQAEKGPHSLTFNAEALSSGIYFYRLSANGFSKTMKMMLLK